MVKKLQKLSADKEAGAQLKGSVKDSAQQIWLAGLGAFAKAQEEGSKVFEALVKDGLGMQRKSQAAAEEKITEATSKMAAMANGITAKATGQWDKLENIFEERVAKALKKLGVPSARDLDTLIARIEELNQNVQKLSGQKPAAKTKAAAPRKAAAPAPTPAADPAPKTATRPARKPKPAAGSATKPAAKRTTPARKTAASPSPPAES